MFGNIKDVEIRVATVDDIRLFYPDGAPHTMYSWLATWKGEPACLAGLIIQRGGCIAYSEIMPGIDAPKLTVWRAARALLDRIKSVGVPLYAHCQPIDARAQAFVRRLGFTHDRELDGWELFKC